MKLKLIAAVSMFVVSSHSAMADLEAKNLKYYRPLMSDLNGAPLNKMLEAIDVPLPQNTVIEFDKKIERREFLKALEDKAKGRTTPRGSIIGLTTFESALPALEFNAKLKTTSMIEAIEYFCASTGNVWQIECTEGGVYLLIKAKEDDVEQAAPSNGG
jgi:hypothetical protein